MKSDIKHNPQFLDRWHYWLCEGCDGHKESQKDTSKKESKEKKVKKK